MYFHLGRRWKGQDGALCKHHLLLIKHDAASAKLVPIMMPAAIPSHCAQAAEKLMILPSWLRNVYGKEGCWKSSCGQWVCLSRGHLGRG